MNRLRTQDGGGLGPGALQILSGEQLAAALEASGEDHLCASFRK